MTSRFLTIQITSAGTRPKRLAIKETHGPLRRGDLVLHLLSPLLPVVAQRNKMTTKGKLIRERKKSHLAISCLESVDLVYLSKLPLRAHQSPPLAAEYAPLEALEPFAPHSDPRTGIALSLHL